MSSRRMHTPDLHDYIGGESCFDFAPDVAVPPSRAATVRSRPRRRAAAEAEEKEYPPPLQRLPWVMKKYITTDGRVLIKEEKAERQHYIRAHRFDGRLLLDLVEPSSSDSGDDDDDNDDDPTVEDQRYVYNEVGPNPCGGFGVQAAFGQPVLT